MTTLVAPTALPRQRSLTDALLAPSAAALDPVVLRVLGDRLRRELTGPTHPAAVPEGTVGRPTLVDGYALRLAITGQARRPDERFAWSTRTARRTLGLASLRRCVAGPLVPADAAAAEVAERARRARTGGARVGSLDHWLAGLGPGGRGAAVAEATTWATHAWMAVDWAQLSDPTAGATLELGPPDRWWRPRPGTPLSTALRGRCDLRWTPAQPKVTTGSVSFLAGRPGNGWRAELGLGPLVDALTRPEFSGPRRVAGCWPQSGRCYVLDVDLTLLEETAEWVLEAARLARTPEVDSRPAAPRLTSDHPASRAVADAAA